MSIANGLFTDSQIRLFRWLIGQPNRAFHLNELGRLTGLGSASLQRELNRLVDARLVDSARVGNLRRFQVNSRSPVFGELISLVRKTISLDPPLRDALQSLVPRLQAAWIYGSVAKQSDTTQSDIDLMLVGEELTLTEVFEHLVPLESELGRKINPALFSPADFRRRLAEPDSFVNRVLAQPIIPLIGDADELARAG
jgi:predicted nucleotidyltransferase